jgi:hypothetical protein
MAADLAGQLHWCSSHRRSSSALLAGLEQLNLWKVRAFLGHNGGRTTSGHRVILLLLISFRRIIFAPGFLGALFAQLQVLGLGLDKGLYAGKALAESSKGRQNHHRVGRQMMRLQIIVV